MCTAFRLNILNGVCNGDLQGCYTFISNSGNSMNDYFMVSEDLFALIQHNSTVGFVLWNELSQTICH